MLVALPFKCSIIKQDTKESHTRTRGAGVPNCEGEENAQRVVAAVEQSEALCIPLGKQRRAKYIKRARWLASR